MADVELGLQEVPRCPENVNRELREFDRRLRCEFNVRECVWEIREFLEKQGAWSHVLFWHDGTWREKKFRPLPHTAGPLIVEVLKRDITRHGGNLAKYALELDSIGAAQRAQRVRKLQDMQSDKIRRYNEWAYEQGQKIQRRFLIGGRDRAAAIRERLDVLRDLDLREG